MTTHTRKLIRIPVRHSCGHFEARLTRWNDDTEAEQRGYLSAGSPCSTCDPQGRPVSQQFPDLATAQAHCGQPLIIWGKKEGHGDWLKLSDYSLAKNLQWRREGWETITRKPGEPALSPLEESRHREASLAEGLRILAKQHGVTLREPLQINALGEFSLVASDGTYGTLAEVLNHHNPRCGVAPGAHLTPQAGWCWMNHFDVERMLTAAGIL